MSSPMQAQPVGIPAPTMQETPPVQQSARSQYRAVRDQTTQICLPLSIEDYCVQTMPDVSPIKWHLAHTTWFFETFVLQQYLPGYRPFHPLYDYFFNSYYESIGKRVPRPERGFLSRPTVDEVMSYRTAIDVQMIQLLEECDDQNVIWPMVLLGLHHEQQHQELMLTDIKHIFAYNPLKPRYKRTQTRSPVNTVAPLDWVPFPAGLQWIGAGDRGFAFDNERPFHRVFVESFQLATRLITNGEYLQFMQDGGYEKPQLWLSDGWATKVQQGWTAPLYWELEGENWQQMTLSGLKPLDLAEPVCHVSFYEADAFARWAGARLPTEFEWETAAAAAALHGNLLESENLHPMPLEVQPQEYRLQQMYGDVWEWTSSPYIAYPGYKPAAGPIGEYNGKFMCNQMVLRGGSCVTPQTHIRATYRNFFPPQARWQFTGIRLAKDV